MKKQDGRSKQRKDPIKNFWSKVDKNGPIHSKLGHCWVWTGSLGKDGYGQHWNGSKLVMVHIFAYEQKHGPLPKTFQGERTYLLHRCDNPPCVRDSHLFVGNQTWNMRDAIQKERNAKKLDSRTVLTIRNDPTVGVSSQKELGQKYGVSQSVIGDILSGLSWKHVGGPITAQKQPKKKVA